MIKKILSRFLSLILAAALFSTLGASAFAEGETASLTLEKGGTVYNLCLQSGIDYYANLDTILKLNGFTSESQLTRMAAGSTVVLPLAGTTPSLISVDEVAFYLMPFLFKEGDTICGLYNLWGMSFDKYADIIRSVNDKENLDYIWVGELLYLPTDAANLMGRYYTTVISHTIKSGETAYDVCRSYGMEFDKVQKKLELYNPGVELIRLNKGQELYLPLLG